MLFGIQCDFTIDTFVSEGNRNRGTSRCVGCKISNGLRWSDNIFCRVQTFLQQAVPFGWLDSLKQLEQLEVDTLVPGHGGICDRSYIAEMRTIIQSWIDAVTQAIEQGLTMEEAQEKLTGIDPYTVEGGNEAMSKRFPRINVARLYQVLKE